MQIRVTEAQLLKALRYYMRKAGYNFNKVNALVFLQRVDHRIPKDIHASYVLAVKSMPN